MIIDHHEQVEKGKDREEYWVHVVIGMLKSEYVEMFKNRKPMIKKTGDVIEIRGLNIDKTMTLYREIKIDDKTMKFRIEMGGD